MLAHIVSLLVLAFAVSVDGFGVGITYGLRRIRIPLFSVLIIALCSGLIIWLSMQVGSWITGYLPPIAAKLTGSIILIAIGIWALLQLRRNRKEESDEAIKDNAGVEGASDAASAEPANPVLVVIVELKRIGLVIQILRTPQAADVDKSGTISASEAVMLGFALSLDAFGAGIGAAMIGLPALWTAVVIAAASALFLLTGIRFGFRFSNWKGMRALSVLPGILLILIGITKLL
ncbi:sporulation membrane protein YtaF [Paenibacillus radicis (ex Gao et al. 2016)]|uniref:Sporulation membrane protein YtaF n=1 Tax=Paenibacillus radicis (ex Gao et al. 2016) TaxID=1737354 RepID=A0A917GNY7_9BACL|nr:sporulation membrane protein YtaF [Paenibacillus radicis (ex Gao et al. 2016)]GGG52568.1 sporulation membrane protein YtaF [Paenibacillus radicis (ex Gao et al. 2016)]